MRPRKNSKDHISLCQKRNHFRDGVSPCESDAVCERSPSHCEGWELLLRGKKEEVTTIHPFIRLLLSEVLLGQVGVAS